MIRLGLDIGTASLGWALIYLPDANNDAAVGSIVAAGVRIFPEGVDRDKGAEKPKNQERREHRAMRRQTRRRSLRRRILREQLQSAGLLPNTDAHLESLLDQDPYAIRAHALDHEVSLHELGRALLHLGTRRGFLSNRRADRKADETGKVYEGLRELDDDIAASGARTLGEYLHTCRREWSPTNPHATKPATGRYLRRAQLDQELTALWESQRRFHPELTDQLLHGSTGRQDFPTKPLARDHTISPIQQFGVRGLLFFQRALWWPRASIGTCELVPGEPRCERADRDAQRFRILTEVNNLRVSRRDKDASRPLSASERERLITMLMGTGKLKLASARKKLRLDPDNECFNVELSGSRDVMPGHETDAALARAKAVGERWRTLDQRTRTRIVQILLDTASDAQIFDRLAAAGLSADEANRAMNAGLPDGRSSYSRHAILKLLPYLEQGLPLSAQDAPCAIKAAGFALPWERLQQRQPVKVAGPVGGGAAALAEIEQPLIQLPAPPPLTNPYVRQALYEVRKVVNAIIRQWGVPDEICVELAREAKQGAQQRQAHTKRLKERANVRDNARAFIEEHGGGTHPKRKLIDRVVLWWEQNKICVYSGRPISAAQMLTEAVDVDHILPRWRSLDDSLMNKVVCFTAENREKGNKTPFEWLAHSAPDRYETLLQRVRILPPAKQRRFVLEEIDQGFVSRNLTDTAYMSRETIAYLQQLPARVRPTKGILTAELRRRWNLNTILDPAGRGEKNRDDHRHHAIDALVIALTDDARLHELSAAIRLRHERRHERRTDGAGFVERYAEPWPEFRQEADEKITAINVSHKPTRRIAGGFHEDKMYGPTDQPGVMVIRRKIQEIGGNKQLREIRDSMIRKHLENHLTAQGIDPDERKYPAECFEGANAPVMPSGMPIKRVRCLIKHNYAIPRDHLTASQLVIPGNNHHVEIFNRRAKWERRVVSNWVVAQRVRAAKSTNATVVDRAWPDDPNAQFIFSVCKGDTLVLNHPVKETLRGTFVVRAIESNANRIGLVRSNDARSESDRRALKERLFASMTDLQQAGAMKVTISPLGALRTDRT